MPADVAMPPDVPVHVQIEVTWRCNWRCVHCYQDDHYVERFTASDLQSLFAQLACAGTMHLIITGGEPLVRGDILDVLHAARDEGLAITLYTNGHRIDAPLARSLSELIGVAELSILAGDDAVHDRLSRVRGSARRTWRAVDLLLEHGVSVALKTPVLRPAYDTLRKIEARAMARGVMWTADPEISPSYAGADYPLAYRLNSGEITAFYRDFPQFSRDARDDLDPGRRAGMCLAGRNYCFIDALGNVYPCLNFKGASDVLESRGQPARAKLGNVTSQPFSEIWRHSQFAQEIRAARRADFTPCTGCGPSEECSPCMALNYEEHGDIHRTSSRVGVLHTAMIDAASPEQRRLLPVTPVSR